MVEKALHTWIGLFFCFLSFGQEVPKIIHFTKQDYRAQNQNWDIAQGKDRQLFVANSGGLLRFDGARWNLHSVPSGQAVRAVECDSSGKVFVGGYETMGYWEAGDDGRFGYQSLLGLMDSNLFGNEEIWHILLLKGQVLFQSFSTIYIYDYQKVRAIEPPGNIMFGKPVNGGIVVPHIGGGLFWFQEDGQFQELPGSGIFGEMMVSDILSFGENGMLVCTQNNGVFKYTNGQFSFWDVPINEELINMQLNKGLRLKNGGYAFGTILGGIYFTEMDGQLETVISQENGLQNNTVLSLFQDQAGQLWAGLDNGIDQIVLDSPLYFFKDKTGDIGTVYAAAIFEGHLYIGTNHGIFYKKHPSEKGDKFKLIAGSQGQIWDLQPIEDQLIGGHNTGTVAISGDQMEFRFRGTGVYTSVRHPDRQDLLFQGTYTGIAILQQDAAGQWQFSNNMDGFFQSTRKLLFDNKNRLWALHARKGLFRLTLDKSLKQVVKTELFSEENGLPSLFQLDMDEIVGEIIFKSGNQFFVYNDEREIFVKKKAIDDEPLPPGNYLLQEGIDDGWFKISPNQVHYFTKENRPVFHLPLVKGSERIVPLAGESYLFCLDDGYAVLPLNGLLSDRQKTPALPLITGLLVEQNKTKLDGLASLEQPYSLGPSENQLTFQFACPNFTFQPAMRYRLLGFDEKWSPFEKVYSKEFSNLSPGEYSFQVQSELSDERAEFRFTIQPKWFQTAWAKACCLLLLIGSYFLLSKWHLRRMKAQKQKLEQEKEQELERQRTLARNEMLQAEILNKSRKLADTTMNLIRKNEMLMKIKEELELATKKRDNGPPGKALTKMGHLIDAHLTNEEDWQVFEANFNQLHDQFFKRLKAQYPDLTPGDLRLGAYLKMNLSSKEIAPLLNISVRGVENKRYRLRHKMGLGGEVNLTEYLMGY